ncbi:hypothetical protein A2U01_0069427, partial [Trifolium medium]|nr:hypothetical protein [Trifolium medium]
QAARGAGARVACAVC